MKRFRVRLEVEVEVEAENDEEAEMEALSFTPYYESPPELRDVHTLLIQER